MCRIRWRGKKEDAGSKALGKKDRSGEEEDEWVGIQLSSKGVKSKPGFAVFFILGM